LDARLWPQLKVRAGKFKTPFGIERLQSYTVMMFIERALPNNLVPNRDIGIQLHGDLASGVLSYALGIFNGVRDGGSADADLYDSKDFAARFMLAPFIKTETAALRQLSFGVAGTTGKHEGTRLVTNLPAYSTPGQAPMFLYRFDGTEAGTTYANGTLTRLSPQAYYSCGPLGLLSEYVISSQEVTRAAATAELENRAWQVAASYALTGELASYRGITAKNSFDHTKGTWGSFEIAARYSQLEVDKGAFPAFANPQVAAQKATAWAVGLNWYLNRNVKILLNYEQTSFTGGGDSGNRPDERVIINRFQIAY
jgi:phosphate-selective porin OprO/OprP